MDESISEVYPNGSSLAVEHIEDHFREPIVRYQLQRPSGTSLSLCTCTMLCSFCACGEEFHIMRHVDSADRSLRHTSTGIFALLTS